MSVIVEFQAPSADFELGRILTVEGVSSVELESLVPTSGSTVPLFWVYNSTRESFVDTIQRHPAVNDVSVVDVFDDRTLFTLDWDMSQDHLFRAINEHDGQLLSASGTPEQWKFELRFPNHGDLSRFTDHCTDAGLSPAITRVYNPTKPDAGPRYGLTEPQLEALGLAVERGYYDIPRSCTTRELADELGISDQAVTERLRRAITALVTHTLVAVEVDS